jgi:hypothetical protein
MYPEVQFKNKPDGKKPVGAGVNIILKLMFKKQSARAWN